MHLVKEIEITKSENGKYGLKDNIKGKVILENIYDLIEKWEHSDSYYFCSNPDENLDIPELYIIIKDHKIGFADKNGVVVEPEYDNLLDEQFTYREKLYPVFVASKDEKYGYIDKYGKPLTEFIYTEVDFPLIGPIAHVLNKNGDNEYINVETNKIIYSHSDNKKVTASITNRNLTLLIENKRYKVFDKERNLIGEFLNNDKLNSAPIRYLNDKLLMYFDETEVGYSMYKIGLVDYAGKILTDMKYSDLRAIAGTFLVIGTNIVGGFDEIINENGEVILSRVKNITSFEGIDENGFLIPPICYWQENDDIADIDKCLEFDLNM